MLSRPCGGVSHARMGGGRRRSRCRGDCPVLPCPIDPSIGVSGVVVSLRARSIFFAPWALGAYLCRWLVVSAAPEGVLVSVVGRPVCKPPEWGARAPVCKAAREFTPHKPASCRATKRPIENSVRPFGHQAPRTKSQNWTAPPRPAKTVQMATVHLDVRVAGPPPRDLRRAPQQHSNSPAIDAHRPHPHPHASCAGRGPGATHAAKYETVFFSRVVVVVVSSVAVVGGGWWGVSVLVSSTERRAKRRHRHRDRNKHINTPCTGTGGTRDFFMYVFRR